MKKCIFCGSPLPDSRCRPCKVISIVYKKTDSVSFRICSQLSKDGAEGRTLHRVNDSLAMGSPAAMSGGLTANFGSMTKVNYAGHAARRRLEAALLISNGFTAAAGLFEDSKPGFCQILTEKVQCDLNMIFKVDLKNGASHTYKVKKRKGSPANPLTQAEVLKKLLDCAGRIYKKSRCEEIAETILNLEHYHDMAEVVDLLVA